MVLIKLLRSVELQNQNIFIAVLYLKNQIDTNKGIVEVQNIKINFQRTKMLKMIKTL